MIIIHPITEGPSKFDLMASLFDGKTVTFTEQAGTNRRKLKVNIVSAERKNGCFDSWELKIYVIESSSSILAGKVYLIYYTSKLREGSIEVKD